MNIHLSSSRLSNLNLGLIRGFTVNAGNYKKNHYDSLGVTPKATQGDIKTAYYKLSKEYHPDLNKGDEDAAEKFRNITAAYEVLGNVKSRKTYDRRLLVGSFHHDETVESAPYDDKYPHASFYHHRNKPTSQKTHTGKSTTYNIDEWTAAHYSKTFDMKNKFKAESYSFKDRTSTDTTENDRSLSTLAMVLIFFACFIFYGSGATSKFDKVSDDSDKPD
ncbi:dnaJ homolog subfamily C member 30, mitochondrial-like [Macrosteles quadrilineatus]|uniref:dnaJ homolog subfamily C member 30, mitochondrial-like n=1 Tax=Macrosteles quadrilineatus TaxID=74068 RepID=UPI0023E0B370|nr:dnaJ homolog subfamily C member 30, mitochondrial-like [Macrosteles quadrilineatus]